MSRATVLSSISPACLTDDEILDRIEEAYAQTGMNPARRVFVRGKCACPLAVLALAHPEPGLPEPDYTFTRRAQDLLSKPPDWVWGFIDGYDGYAAWTGSGVDYLDGHHLGLRARNRFLARTA